jgi:hypothetical protein
MLGGLSATEAWAARVAAISPQGEVAHVRQVVVKFSDAVVPLGDLRRAAPYVVSCSGPAPAGEGRWTSERSWAWDFRAALPPGVRCEIKPVPGWAPHQGTLDTPPQAQFATGGPAIARVDPYDGATIEEDQHFLLRLTGPATPASVQSQAWCEVDGIGERIALRIVEGEPRQQVRAPLREVEDQRRLQQGRRRALQQQRHHAVGRDQRPVPVDQQRGAGFVALQHPLKRLARRRQCRVVEAALAEHRRVAGGGEQAVALAQRHLEALGQAQQHLAAGQRAPGLDIAEVARGHRGLAGEIELAEAGPLPPPAQQFADGQRRTHGGHDSAPRVRIRRLRPRLWRAGCAVGEGVTRAPFRAFAFARAPRTVLASGPSPRPEAPCQC